MDEILWHRRESRRQTEKTNLVLCYGSLLSTHKVPVEKDVFPHFSYIEILSAFRIEELSLR